jgi:hypothetical protein
MKINFVVMQKGKKKMNKFIEIESRHGRLFYINVAQIVCVENFETYRIIYLTDKDNIETFESYEDIKAKLMIKGE